jgi:hypothetical protein
LAWARTFDEANAETTVKYQVHRMSAGEWCIFSNTSNNDANQAQNILAMSRNRLCHLVPASALAFRVSLGEAYRYQMRRAESLRMSGLCRLPK